MFHNLISFAALPSGLSASPPGIEDLIVVAGVFPMLLSFASACLRIPVLVYLIQNKVTSKS